MADAFLKNLVGRQPDRVQETLGFQKLVDVRRGKGSIPSEVAAQVSFPVTLDDGFQNAAPVVGAMDIAGTQRTPFKIAKLVEQEQGVVASAAEVPVVGRAFLIAVGRAPGNRMSSTT